ncbi:hypothetical protein D3H65_05765 [Paraflavitalea soli]|uniref:Uncharacterized protein n=1 Tax=Paraflavitalea soli TaxID=2315862 RepID=A0A3B7MJN4_9BACT|nr:hypothetical protein [Paraflavitalea soli]AXY73513.1 hypothetical protein D3H65_05765 [Paraflavitalea soli]
MENDNLHTPFTRSVMAGLFTGIVAAVVCMVFNNIYRTVTYFELSAIINVASIIFAIPLILLVAGFGYYGLSKYKRGTIVYWAIAILITGICLFLDSSIQRTSDAHLNVEFRQLLSGIIIISGLASFCIPYLATHETNII